MKLPSITLTQAQISRIEESIQKEWLITNGIGGYASCTVPAVNTRKYHGLLTAALNPPGNRTVCLSKLDEDLIFGNQVYRLGSNDFGDTIYPEGFTLLSQFSLSPFPKYTFDVGGVKLEKTIFMPQGKNVVHVIYHILNSSQQEGKLLLYPLMSCRYFHNVASKHDWSMNFQQTQTSHEVQVSFPNQHVAVTCQCTQGEFNPNINWLEKLNYRVDASNGESSIDDCFQSGFFEVNVPVGESKFAVVAAVNQPEEVSDLEFDIIESSFKREVKRQTDLLDAFYNFNSSIPESDWLSWIVLAADSFVVQNEFGEKSIIAGYHWFEPWGRDTFISMPGLLLVRGRFCDAREVLQTFSNYLNEGLIPNFVADHSGQAGYNTVDATLWFVNSVWQYLKYTADTAFVQDKLWGKLQSIIDWHQKGTMYEIRVDSDGLLMHGSRLTWMDAMVGGNAITAREGKAVEIQALWYNTLQIMHALAEKFKEKELQEKYAEMANKASQSFNSKFWNPNFNCLFDVYASDGADPSLRPNQIFAVSLDFCMLDKERCRHVVEVVQSGLFTPYGLRTLSFDDPKFVGMCAGERHNRDKAYHNGTIWPWLLGPFITANLKVNNYSPESRAFASKNFVEPLFQGAVAQSGLGSVNEIYDCESPNTPRGCISQAWSVAEPLRAYIEDVLMIRPKFEKQFLDV
ncbi:MAG: glycogen debranching enzyme N-terminal domain-containing protein [Candidatus Bathyarchaeota archaeon]|nr:glycogen debranching enzyme N-terminal domain-containing protein [Candidatus Bathyarchaeota archaeon]